MSKRRSISPAERIQRLGQPAHAPTPEPAPEPAPKEMDPEVASLLGVEAPAPAPTPTPAPTVMSASREVKAVIDFNAWLQSNEGQDATDPRLPSDTVRRVVFLEDAVRKAFLAGFNAALS